MIHVNKLSSQLLSALNYMNDDDVCTHFQLGTENERKHHAFYGTFKHKLLSPLFGTESERKHHVFYCTFQTSITSPLQELEVGACRVLCLLVRYILENSEL